MKKKENLIRKLSCSFGDHVTKDKSNRYSLVRLIEIDGEFYEQHNVFFVCDRCKCLYCGET